MGGTLTNNRGTSFFALLDQKSQQLGADEGIEVDGDFVQKQDVPVAHQSHAQLDPSTFSIRNLVHTPV